MAKIVLVGAGSHVFSRIIISDILSYPELRGSTITLVDINKEALEPITAFARKLVEQNKFNTRIESTTSRREALGGADYVTTTIRVGERQQPGRVIPAKYGIDQGVGDTTGPGGVFYALRHIPVLLDICHDMEELCPDAWLINYTNPMAMICWAMNDYTKIKNVGLCHSVQGTAGLLAKYIDVPFDDDPDLAWYLEPNWTDESVAYWVAGINHMAWFLELKWHGKDVYPLLREKFKDPKTYWESPNVARHGPDVVRAEIFKAFGYFVTESSNHMSEYVPYFRKRPELLEKFGLPKPGPAREERMLERRRKEDEELNMQLSTNYKFPTRRSKEYCATIINSIETGIPSRINGNVRNNGLITNLLEGCCVEVPCLVDKRGINPCYVGDLPPQLASLNRAEINVHELAVRGIVEKDKTKIFHSILLDPLTSAILTIDETRQMVDEMFQAEKDYLKGFK